MRPSRTVDPVAEPSAGVTSERTDPRKIRSRATVLATTGQLRAQRGIAGTTIEAVAEHSGVAKTTIYRQWASQSALIRVAFDSIPRTLSDPDIGSLHGDLLRLLTASPGR